MLPPSVIRTAGLTRRFPGVVAADDLALEVARGAVYGFLGPNGAGKTVTIRMLLGLLRPTAGEVLLFEQRLERRSRRGLLGRIGALVEAPSLYGHLTGRENLEVTRRLLGVSRKRVGAVLSEVGLSDAASRAVRDYSLGMRQRLGIALALLSEPELLVLDEPTNGLDPAGIHEVRQLIRTLPVQRGITVFLSSHLLSEVEQVATDIGIIRGGRLLFQGPAEALQVERQPRVLLLVDRTPEALRLLRAAGWSAARREDEPGAIVVDASSPDDAARINTLLVLQGVTVRHLSLARSSLEDIFLRMTGSPRDPVPTGGSIAAGRPR